MSEPIHPIWAQLQAEFEALTPDTPPEQAADVFARSGALMCTAALHMHPAAENYITTRVVDEASGRHAVVSATWQDGVAPLAKLAIFEETLQALAAEGNEQALDAIDRARYQLGKSHSSDVADLRAAAAGEPVTPPGGPTLDDRIATVIERLPSGGAIVDRLAREVARLTKGLVRVAAGEVDAKVLVTLLVSGVEPDEAVRSARSLGGESIEELRETAEIWEARCRRYETHMFERVPMQYWPEYADATAELPEGHRAHVVLTLSSTKAAARARRAVKTIIASMREHARECGERIRGSL